MNRFRFCCIQDWIFWVRTINQILDMAEFAYLLSANLIRTSDKCRDKLVLTGVVDWWGVNWLGMLKSMIGQTCDNWKRTSSFLAKEASLLPTRSQVISHTPYLNQRSPRSRMTMSTKFTLHKSTTPVTPVVYLCSCLKEEIHWDRVKIWK